MSAEPLPSATVVTLRDTDSGLEVLLLERNTGDPSRRPWVFPGGKVDPQDVTEGTGDVVEHARRAAVRELLEEAALEVSDSHLGLIARWITPPIAPRRFDTWFFCVDVGREASVQVDGDEIRSHLWLEPRIALAAQQSGEIRLAPPTFVTVNWLAEHGSSREALAGLVRQSVPAYEPCICKVEEGAACMLYPGDAGYEDGDWQRAGPRNRLWSGRSGMRYERSES